MPELRTREVLKVVLLQTLSSFKEGLAIHKAYEEVDGRYTFPDHWYREIPASTGYDELRRQGLDWREISQDRLVQLVPTEPQWQNEMRWARNDLREAGLLDETAPRGIWRLTTKGIEIATQSQADLSPEERTLATPKPRPRTPNEKTSPAKIQPLAPSHRESLQQKLSVLTSSMSTTDLHLLVDIARSIRLRAVEQ